MGYRRTCRLRPYCAWRSSSRSRLPGFPVVPTWLPALLKPVAAHNFSDTAQNWGSRLTLKDFFLIGMQRRQGKGAGKGGGGCYSMSAEVY